MSEGTCTPTRVETTGMTAAQISETVKRLRMAWKPELAGMEVAFSAFVDQPYKFMDPFTKRWHLLLPDHFEAVIAERLVFERLKREVCDEIRAMFAKARAELGIREYRTHPWWPWLRLPTQVYDQLKGRVSLIPDRPEN